MTLRILMCAASGALAFSALASTSGAANYDESSSPDLSDAPSAPTPFVLDSGENILTGSAGAGDFDLVRFTIPSGGALTSLTLASYVNPFNSVSFVALGAGSTWNAGLDFDVNPSALLGWAHIGNPNTGVGDDLLAPMSIAPLSPGFTRPLGAGDYTFLVQDTDNTITYSLVFDVDLPSPPTPGDFDGNGSVDGEDLAKWAADFGLGAGSDADADSDTDGADFIIWQQNIGGGTISATPEPGAANLFLWAMIAGMCSTRRASPGRRH